MTFVPPSCGAIITNNVGAEEEDTKAAIDFNFALDFPVKHFSLGLLRQEEEAHL